MTKVMRCIALICINVSMYPERLASALKVALAAALYSDKEPIILTVWCSSGIEPFCNGLCSNLSLKYNIKVDVLVAPRKELQTFLRSEWSSFAHLYPFFVIP